MEENLIQTELDSVSESNQEPTSVDNSCEVQKEEVCQENEVVQDSGESSKKEDPVEELILGKFKSVDDLAKAYEELQRHQGQNSEELGNLRKELNSFNTLKKDIEQVEKFKNVYNVFAKYISSHISTIKKFIINKNYSDKTSLIINIFTSV